jgi:hypothetical protein
MITAKSFSSGCTEEATKSKTAASGFLFSDQSGPTRLRPSTRPTHASAILVVSHTSSIPRQLSPQVAFGCVFSLRLGQFNHTRNKSGRSTRDHACERLTEGEVLSDAFTYVMGILSVWYCCDEVELSKSSHHKHDGRCSVTPLAPMNGVFVIVWLLAFLAPLLWFQRMKKIVRDLCCANACCFLQVKMCVISL